MDGRLTKLPQGVDQVLQVDPEPEALERRPPVGHGQGEVVRAAADLLHTHHRTGGRAHINPCRVGNLEGNP